MRRKIERVLNEVINPEIELHGGRIELVDYVDGVVHVKMEGGCQGCAQSKFTLRQGVERLLKDEFGDKITEIVDVTDHQSGDKPFFA